ncbi:MAG: hypothetical protein V4480_04465 [Patescibacteria group bacterium]
MKYSSLISLSIGVLLVGVAGGLALAGSYPHENLVNAATTVSISLVFFMGAGILAVLDHMRRTQHQEPASSEDALTPDVLVGEGYTMSA